MSITPLINRKEVKRFSLEVASRKRAQGFTRVGRSFIDRVHARLRTFIVSEIMAHPSKGRTLL